MILQLNPSIPVLTPKGLGEAIGWIDDSKEDHLKWIVFLNENGQCWTFENPQIRACPNWTIGRMVGKADADVVKEIQDRSPAWQDTKV